MRSTVFSLHVALALALLAGSAGAADVQVGALVSSGASVNNATTGTPFVMPAVITSGTSRLALQCTGAVYYALGTSSSVAATSASYQVNPDLDIDATGRAYVAILPVSGSATCQVFQTTVQASRATSRAQGTTTIAGTVTVNQGTAAAKAGAWPVYLTDGGVGTFADPIRTDPVGTTTQPVRVMSGQDGGVLVAVELAGATNEVPACTMPCTVTSATLLFNANANRRSLSLKNNGTATCYWGYTSGVTTSAYTGSLGAASSSGAGDGVGKSWLPAPIETIYGVGLSGCIFEGDAR